jgi:hypothetical protein
MDRFAKSIGPGKAKADFRSIETMIDPDAEIALQFWRARPFDGIRIGRDVPSRTIARLLSRIAICEPTPDGGDYRMHLVGSVIHQRLGRDVTGEYISEIFDDPSEFQMRLNGLNDVIKTGEPRMMRIVHRIGSIELMRHEVVVLPVTAPNGIDRWALVFAFYF